MIIRAKDYPLGTMLSGVWDELISLPNRKQKIRFRDVSMDTGMDTISIPYAEMYANYTLGDFIEKHGYNAQTIKGHKITFINREKFGIGFGGDPYALKVFFDPFVID